MFKEFKEFMLRRESVTVAVGFVVVSAIFEMGTRACPECISPISSAAKRCPNCTAVVQPELA